MLWDTAGQEEFDAITKAYYRGAQACVVAFSTVDRASFEAVRRWKKKVQNKSALLPTYCKMHSAWYSGGHGLPNSEILPSL